VINLLAKYEVLSSILSRDMEGRGVYTRGNGARCTMAKIGGEMLW